MLTIKNVKEFRGLDQKAVITTAETIGRNASEETVYGNMVGLALGAGATARDNGVKGYTFERAFDAFAKEYMPDASDGTMKAYRSALNAWAKAGMHAEWGVALGVRVFNEKGLSLTARGGMLNKLLGDKEPNAKEYAAAKPKSSNVKGGSTLKGAAGALNRSVVGFGEKWLDKLPADMQATFADLQSRVEAFADAAAKIADGEPKPKGKKGGKEKPTFAQRAASLKEKLAALTSGKPQARGVRTIQ